MMKFVIVVIILTVINGCLLLSSTNAQKAPYVHHEIYEQLQNHGDDKDIPVMIYLHKNANLESIQFYDTNDDNIISRAEKRTQVYQYLKQFTKINQHNVINTFAKHSANESIQYTSFWIVNTILVENLNEKLLHELLNDSSSSNDIKKILPASHNGLFRIKQIPSLKKSNNHKNKNNDIQWNIEKINANKLWAKGFNGTGVVVATLDGGVNYQHESLINNYRGTSADGKTFNHDYNWNDWAYKNKVPFDSEGHGTNVQGIATSSNGYGVAFGAKWISGKIFNYAGYSATSWTIGGCQWAMCPSPVNQPGKNENCSLGADVVSCSWGEDDATEPYLKKIISAWEKADMIPVFAVGNGGPKCGTSVSPSDYQGVVGVGASSQQDNILDYSSRGPANINGSALISSLPYTPLAPSIVAPGYDIQGPSCNSNDGYKGMSGTSQAAPHVAGAAALLLSTKPNLSSKQILQALHDGAEQKDLQDPDGDDSCGGIEWNKFPNYIYGYGRLDCYNAYTNLIKKN